MRFVTYKVPAQRILFGRGTLAQVADKLRKRGRSCPPVLSDPARLGRAVLHAASPLSTARKAAHA